MRTLSTSAASRCSARNGAHAACNCGHDEASDAKQGDDDEGNEEDDDGKDDDDDDDDDDECMARTSFECAGGGGARAYAAKVDCSSAVSSVSNSTLNSITGGDEDDE